MSMTRPPYPSAFREQMVELVRSGRSPEELAREFEPSAQSIRNWVGQADRDEGRSHEGLTVDRRAILTPQYQATSIAYRADRRATHAPNNSRRLDSLHRQDTIVEVTRTIPGAREPDAFLFPRYAEGRGQSGLVTCWFAVCADAQLRRLRLHDPRHTMVS